MAIMQQIKNLFHDWWKPRIVNNSSPSVHHEINNDESDEGIEVLSQGANVNHSIPGVQVWNGSSDACENYTIREETKPSVEEATNAILDELVSVALNKYKLSHNDQLALMTADELKELCVAAFKALDTVIGRNALIEKNKEMEDAFRATFMKQLTGAAPDFTNTEESDSPF